MTSALAKGLYYRGNSIWLRYKDESGVWKNQSSGFKKGDEQSAERCITMIRSKIAAKSISSQNRPTLAHVFSGWIERLQRRGRRSWRDDEARLRKHIMPELGELPIDSITALQIEDTFNRLRDKDLAPKTIWNIYSALRALFKDAVKHQIVPTSPCLLGNEELGSIVDKDPEWRDQALFSRDEISTLMFDVQIPWDRRVYYAIKYLAGLRLGEVSGLRVRHLDLDREPLGSLLIARSYEDARTKTKTSKRMPVHPVLRTVLQQWLREGFPTMFGREAKPDDYIVPRPPESESRFGDARDKNFVRKQLQKDLNTTELRHRRIHDMRRSFITHAQQDGASPDILARLTHPSGRKASSFAGYTTFSWENSCAEVAKLQVKVLEIDTEVAARAAASGDDGPDEPPPRPPSPGQSRAPSYRTTAAPKRALLRLAALPVTENEKALEDPGLGSWRRRESNPGPRAF